VSPALRAGAVPAVLAVLLLAPAAARAQDPVPPEPTVAVTAPASGAALGAGVPATLAANVSDGTKVLTFQVDGIPVCVLTLVHYCTWTPGAADVGDRVIEARVTDAQNRAAAATTPVRVDRLAPKVTARVKRRSIGRRSWRLTTKGSVRPPTGLGPAACAGGRTKVTVRAGKRTLVDRTVRASADCRFVSRISLLVPRAARKLRVTAAFEGTALVARRSAPARTVRLR
jgi:hypothetical protein